MRLIKYEIIIEKFPKFYLFLFIELLRKSLFALCFFWFFINRKFDKLIKNLEKIIRYDFFNKMFKNNFSIFLIIISPILENLILLFLAVQYSDRLTCCHGPCRDRMRVATRHGSTYSAHSVRVSGTYFLTPGKWECNTISRWASWDAPQTLPIKKPHNIP